MEPLPGGAERETGDGEKGKNNRYRNLIEQLSRPARNALSAV